MCLSVLAVTLVLAAPGVRAEATETAFAAEVTFDDPVDPGRIWVDEDGVTHVRGQIVTGSFTGGDISGTVSGVQHVNVDATGNGDVFGSFTIEGTWAGLSGTFSGRFSGEITGGPSAGEFVGQGSGGFQGMKIMGSFADTAPGVLALDGIILNPHG